ncbi:hypothetical protein FRC11_007196, partial [Ceratobasidium sp. 423]
MSSCRHRQYVLTRSSVIGSYRWHEFLALDDDDFGAPAQIQNLGNGWDLDEFERAASASPQTRIATDRGLDPIPIHQARAQ